ASANGGPSARTRAATRSSRVTAVRLPGVGERDAIAHPDRSFVRHRRTRVAASSLNGHGLVTRQDDLDLGVGLECRAVRMAARDDGPGGVLELKASTAGQVQ